MIGGGALAKEARERFGARHADGRGRLVEAEGFGGRRVAARDAQTAVVDDDAIRDRVHGLFPESLARADDLQQARIVERERGHLGQAFEHLPLLGRKRVRRTIADDERTARFAAHAQRRERRIAHALRAVQRKFRRR